MTADIDIMAAHSYLVIKLAIQYVDGIDKEGRFRDATLEQKLIEFNRQNDFGLEKINLFPFLITIANGTKQVLLNFFNMKFEPVSYGVIHHDINLFLSSLKNLDVKDKLFDVSHSNTLIITDRFKDISETDIESVIKSWLKESGKKIFDDTLSEHVELLAEESAPKMFEFGNVYILIDHGIECLNDKFRDFACQPVGILSGWIISTMAFKKYFKYKDSMEKDVLYEQFNRAVQIEQYEFI